MKSYTLLVLSGVCFVSGCSTNLSVSRMSDVNPGQEVNGLPFRVPKRFNALIFEKRQNGYERVTAIPVTLPDPNHLYLLNLEGKPFSNATVEVVANADNTLQQVSIKSASQGAAALTAAGTQINAIATAQQATQTAKATADTAAATAAIAADKAKQAADLAVLQYDELAAKPDTKAESLLVAQQKVRSAKLDANEAARLARKPPYFPDVIP